MTSPRRSGQNSAGDVTGCDPAFSTSVTGNSTTEPFGAFYDDSLRPKSFLHDEVDEFNRVLAELLQSRQRPQPTAAEADDLMCCSAWSDDAFRVTQPPDLPRTNNHAVYDSKTQNDSRRLGSQSYVTHWANDRCGEEDEDETVDDDVDDDDDVVVDNALEIVEEGDHHLPTKECSSHLSRYVFTDDLFHEVSREYLSIIMITIFYTLVITNIIF